MYRQLRKCILGCSRNINILGKCWDFKKRFSLTFILVQFTEGQNLSYSPLAGGSEPNSPKTCSRTTLFTHYFHYLSI